MVTSGFGEVMNEIPTSASLVGCLASDPRLPKSADGVVCVRVLADVSPAGARPTGHAAHHGDVALAAQKSTPALAAAAKEQKRIGRFNLTILGTTGVGKSFLLNAAFGETKAATREPGIDELGRTR